MGVILHYHIFRYVDTFFYFLYIFLYFITGKSKSKFTFLPTTAIMCIF